MAYFRPTAASHAQTQSQQFVAMSTGTSSSVSISSSSASTSGTMTNNGSAIMPLLDGDIDQRESAKLRRIDEGQRPLALFGIEMTHWSPLLQYIVLFGGLILFMCLYGYYQELVIYGWFDRKLSVFSTFLHFLGCSVFAQVQRNLSFKQAGNSSSSSSSSSSTAAAVSPKGGLSGGIGVGVGGVMSGAAVEGSHACHFCSMGTAPTKVAIFYYALLVLVRTGGQGMSNLSMTQINYPAKVLFKSANPVVTMIIGVTLLKRTYPFRDYIVVVMLVIGLYIFIAGDASESPSSTRLGVIYVVISMFGSAGVPMIQEHCMTVYNASVEDLLYHCYVGSTFLSLIVSIILGEFGTGVMFLVRSGSVHTWLLMAGFCTFGYAGNNFSAALTLQYGALVNGISNTFRKALTIALSFVLFPERNVFSSQKLIGTLIFFAGLLIRIFGKAETNPWQSISSLFGTSSDKVSDKLSGGHSSPGRKLSRSRSGDSDFMDNEYSKLAGTVSEVGVLGVGSIDLEDPHSAHINNNNNTNSSSSIAAASAHGIAGAGSINSNNISNSNEYSNEYSNGHLLPPMHSNGHRLYPHTKSRTPHQHQQQQDHPHFKLSAAARFQAMVLAESSDNLLDIETAYKHEDGTILTGPFAGREFSNDEGDADLISNPNNNTGGSGGAVGGIAMSMRNGSRMRSVV